MHPKKMVLRVVVDVLLIVVGLFIVTVVRALFPPNLPNRYTPKDLGFEYEEIIFHATDGKKLSGWLIYSPEAKGTVICCHGYPANKSDILPAVSFLYPKFNLFLFDFRGHGDSQGKLVSFGLMEDRDILGAIDYIKKSPRVGELPIGIWGYSLGGAVAIKVCANDAGDVKALVTDSTYASFPEMVVQYYGNLGPLKYILSSGGKALGKILFRGGLSALSPEEFIGNSNVPILIIHAGGDPFVPVEHAKKLYKNAQQPKELLILSNKMHGANITKEYKSKVKDFFKKYLSLE